MKKTAKNNKNTTNKTKASKQSNGLLKTDNSTEEQIDKAKETVENFEKLNKKKSTVESWMMVFREIQALCLAFAVMFLIALIADSVLHVENVVTDYTVYNNLEKQFTIFFIPFIIFRLTYEILKAYSKSLDKRISKYEYMDKIINYTKI